MSERYAQGMKTRRAVLGDAHVNRAEAAKTPFDAAFQSLITESAWGTVWSSDGISKRERSMLTLGILAATGNFEEIPMHIRATAPHRGQQVGRVGSVPACRDLCRRAAGQPRAETGQADL